jgi:hypothetical protein
MSKLEVNAIEPQSGTTLTLGASGDTITIPAGATISNSGTAAGFGPTGAVSWNTTKITANPNPAVTGVGYFCDTTSAAFTVTLPATPAAGAVVGIADYANTFATNNLTVGRNGSNIGGFAADGKLSTNGLSVTFVYVDATQGWIVTDSGNRSDLPTPTFIAATGGTITTCGNYKIHTFTGPGTFTVSSLGNPSGGPNNVDYLVVAGGGGGGWDRAGGGGAGGFRESVPSPAAWTASPLASPGGALPVSVTGYPITVGGGGPGGTPSPGPGTAGSNSVFSTITSAGGGGGKAAPAGTAGNGGSGGGGSAPGNGGTGNTPPVNPSQGNAGGNAPSVPTNSGAGAGGATAAGSDGTVRTGGAGATTSISGSSTAYAGGGGGGYSDAVAGGSGPGGAGGTGGGGKGGDRPMTPTNGAVAGTTNTGGGGGGGANGPNSSPLANGAAGGSGIVIIRYKFQ